MNQLTLIFLIIFGTQFSNAQTAIELVNPSFEDEPRASKTPTGWFDCGFPGQTPPNIHAETSTFFQVNHKPSDGITYLGLVTRRNGTWEKISQRLESTLKQNTDYYFSIDLASADTLMSASIASSVAENFNRPVIFKLWGGNGFCAIHELLAETKVINHDEWKQYEFLINASRDIDYILLEVYYKDGDNPQNGNLLLDNCSPIQELCSSAYPNPTSGSITIVPSPIDGTIYSVINSQGQVLKEVIVNNQLVDLKGLPSGIYFLTRKNTKYLKSIKVVVQN